jgi:hypothetical protein
MDSAPVILGPDEYARHVGDPDLRREPADGLVGQDPPRRSDGHGGDA